ncbi:MAG: tetratricopeptide repeat protein, partial [Desulforhabdus sp.]|nr:tetratricopeptide repeat protein [Desulforhabdus sp.]
MARKGRTNRYRLDDSLIRSKRTKKSGVGRYALLILLLLAGAGAIYFYFSNAQPGVDVNTIASYLPVARKVESVTFLQNDKKVEVNPDSTLVLNPADSLQLLHVRTDGWFSWGVKAVSSEFEAQLLRSAPVTVKDIWPEESFETPKEVQIQFLRWKMPIGKISLLIRLDARDWLQKANSAVELSDKIGYLEKALAENPTNTLAKTQLAARYMEDKEFSKAARLYEEIAKSGKSRSILEQLLASYKSQRQVDKALEVYLQLLKLSEDPDDFKAMLNYLEKSKSAMETANFLQRRQRDIPAQFHNSLLLYMADLRTQTRNWSDAAAAYEKALKTGVKDPDILYNLAVIYEKGGDLDRAVNTMEQYLKKKPNDTKSWMQLAAMQEKKGSLPQAQAIYEKILQQNPQ